MSDGGGAKELRIEFSNQIIVIQCCSFFYKKSLLEIFIYMFHPFSNPWLTWFHKIHPSLRKDQWGGHLAGEAKPPEPRLGSTQWWNQPGLVAIWWPSVINLIHNLSSGEGAEELLVSIFPVQMGSQGATNWVFQPHDSNIIWLVVWNMTFIFPYIGNVIIPTDFHIFQDG